MEWCENLGEGRVVNEDKSFIVYGYDCDCGSANGKWAGKDFYPSPQVWFLDKDIPRLAMAHHLIAQPLFVHHRMMLTQQLVTYIDRTDDDPPH